MVTAFAFKDRMTGSNSYALAVIVILCIGSVLIVYGLRQRKGDFEKKLDPEFFKEYETIRDAVVNSQLSNATQKEIKDDILDLFLSAQGKGKKAGDVVADSAVMAKDIIDAYMMPRRQWLIRLMDSALSFSSLVVGVQLLLWLEEPALSIFAVEMDITMVVFLAMVAFWIIPVTKKSVASNTFLGYLLPVVSGMAYVLSVTIMRRYLSGFGWIKQFLNGTIHMIPTMSVLLIIGAAMITLLYTKRMIRRNPMNVKI